MLTGFPSRRTVRSKTIIPHLESVPEENAERKTNQRKIPNLRSYRTALDDDKTRLIEGKMTIRERVFTSTKKVHQDNRPESRHPTKTITFTTKGEHFRAIKQQKSWGVQAFVLGGNLHKIATVRGRRNTRIRTVKTTRRRQRRK